MAVDRIVRIDAEAYTITVEAGVQLMAAAKSVVERRSYGFGAVKQREAA